MQFGSDLFLDDYLVLFSTTKIVFLKEKYNLLVLGPEYQQ